MSGPGKRANARLTLATTVLEERIMDQNNLNQSGIYAIINRTANKVYVGSAVSVKQRWHLHRSHLRRGISNSRRLQSAWNKHGEEAFSFYMLEAVEKSRLIEREQLWIDGLMAANPHIGYNIRENAGSMLGFKHSDETLRRMSKGHAGVKRGPISKEHQRKMVEAAAKVTRGKSRIFTPEHCARLSEANRRKAPASPETRAKMANAQRKRKGSIKKRMARVRLARWQLSFKF